MFKISGLGQAKFECKIKISSKPKIETRENLFLLLSFKDGRFLDNV